MSRLSISIYLKSDIPAHDVSQSSTEQIRSILGRPEEIPLTSVEKRLTFLICEEIEASDVDSLIGRRKEKECVDCK